MHIDTHFSSDCGISFSCILIGATQFVLTNNLKFQLNSILAGRAPLTFIRSKVNYFCH